MLTDRGHDVIVVERDAGRCDRLSDEYLATVIHGDASDPTVLAQADLEGRDVVGALTGETGTNVAVCLEAKRLNPDVRTVLRVDGVPDDHYAEFADVVVNPERAGGRLAASAMLGEESRTLEGAPGDLELMYLRVAEGASVAGERLRDVRLPAGSLVISAEAGNRVATAETVLAPGEQYLVAVEPSVADEVVTLLQQ
jgi:trk system potassium uptake protein TrkA